MLVVMFILLMATATAVYAVHSTTYEIRAAGYGRRAMQTQALGENGLVGAMTWVDQNGPDTLLLSTDRSMNASQGLDLTPFEPALDTGKRGLRLYGTHDNGSGVSVPGELNTGTRTTIDATETSLGQRQPFEAMVMVDVYDVHTWTGTIPGYSAAGGASLKFLGATYTSRGRARMPNAPTVDAADSYTQFHETASDARARGISGPF